MHRINDSIGNQGSFTWPPLYLICCAWRVCGACISFDSIRRALLVSDALQTSEDAEGWDTEETETPSASARARGRLPFAIGLRRGSVNSAKEQANDFRQCNATRMDMGHDPFTADWSSYHSTLEGYENVCTMVGIYESGERPEGKTWTKQLKYHISQCEKAEDAGWQAEVRSSAFTEEQGAKFEAFLSELPTIERELEQARRSQR